MPSSTALSVTQLVQACIEESGNEECGQKGNCTRLEEACLAWSQASQVAVLNQGPALACSQPGASWTQPAASFVVESKFLLL